MLVRMTEKEPPARSSRAKGLGALLAGLLLLLASVFAVGAYLWLGPAPLRAGPYLVAGPSHSLPIPGGQGYAVSAIRDRSGYGVSSVSISTPGGSMHPVLDRVWNCGPFSVWKAGTIPRGQQITRIRLTRYDLRSRSRPANGGQ